VSRPLFDLLPRGSVAILREVLRIVLRRPVVGIVAIAHRLDGALLLIKRGDTGQWALPGGTLEWGESLRSCITRELAEEAGARVLSLGRLVGVFGEPTRDPRLHGVTIAVLAEVDDGLTGPQNRIEVHDAAFFAPDALPGPLAFGMEDMLRAARDGVSRWE
jgi:8-oxo-dGTP diphosphatase